MIGLYNGRVFCVDMTAQPIDIWRYDYVDGFKKATTRKGTTYYEKSVDITELDEIFDVGFSVKWHGEWIFGQPKSNNSEIYSVVGSDLREFAQNNGFSEGDRDRGSVVTWWKTFPIDECEEFRTSKTTYLSEFFTAKDHTKKETVTFICTKEEWLDIYQKTQYELSPWNYSSTK